MWFEEDSGEAGVHTCMIFVTFSLTSKIAPHLKFLHMYSVSTEKISLHIKIFLHGHCLRRPRQISCMQVWHELKMVQVKQVWYEGDSGDLSSPDAPSLPLI